MDLKHSTIINITLRSVFPFVILLSFQLFSYGANSPGGGFQAGVLLGTMVVILEVLRERRIYSNAFYQGLEVAGVLMLIVFCLIGWAMTGHPFGGFYAWRGRGVLFSNLYFWLLNLAIYLEVAGSIVLLFRYFTEWKDEPDRS
jgi:multicomponent Na+:H+ antiporter subunit B